MSKPTYTFSFAGYLLSVGAGCVVVGVLGSSVVGVGGAYSFVFGFFALMFGLIVGMVLFLPVVLAGIWLGNRLGLRSPLFAAGLGALGGALYSLPLLGAGVQWSAGIVAAVAGAVAGLVYLLTERIDREGRRRPRGEVVSPPRNEQ